MGVMTARRNNSTFAKDWLSDPSTYPILGIVTGAVVFCCGFMSYKITYDPAVRITKGHKGQVIRTWGGSN